MYMLLRNFLKGIIVNQEEQGYQTAGLSAELANIPDSYDNLIRFGKKLASLPLKEDWPFVEPNELEEIWIECDPTRPKDPITKIDFIDCSKRAETAFLSSVCACMLGKPLEAVPCPDFAEIKTALEKTNEWPLDDYVSEAMLDVLGRRNESWVDTTRGHIKYVAPDDDITYTILGMLLLEKHGLNFTKDHIRQLWIEKIPIYTAWGPERTMLLKAGLFSLNPECRYDLDSWVNTFNPGNELCGALIRADAYGYACPGRPSLAAELAWRDASWTHRRTGIYGAMFIAAVISLAQVMEDRFEIFTTALKYVPQHSRFHKIVADMLAEVRNASNWLDGYNRIHQKYSQYTACMVYQEVGTVINSLIFAENISDGFCKQVSQGNDTDSFGATAGSILGAYFGPDYFDFKWIEPFNDLIYTTMGNFKEHKLTNLVKRMGRLSQLIEKELAKEKSC